jgi:hypothetical protein
MQFRTLLVSAILTTGLGGLAPVSRADLIAVGDQIEVAKPDIAVPSRGMSMNQVAGKFGEPTTKVPPVGKPPITRWDYPGFVVYFDHEYVIHCVVSTADSSTSTPEAPPAAPSAPAPAPAPAG